MKQEIVDYEPIFGEVVAYFDPLLARWTRCSVEGIKEEDKRMRSYRLWLIDEGYPKVVDMEHLKPLPEKFHDKSSTIVKQGAIKNIIPGHCVYDPLVEELRKTVCFSWNKQATDVIHSLIKGTQKICFTNVSTYPFGKESICIGDLLFHVNTKTFNASAVLSEWAMGLIVDSEAFTNYMFESKEILSSKASSLVSASLDDTKSLSYEQLFDDSASTIGETTTQKPLVDESLSHSETEYELMHMKLTKASTSEANSHTTTPELVPKTPDAPTMPDQAHNESSDKVGTAPKSHYRVLVHGSKLPNPIDRIEAANFSPRVHQNLEQLGITKIHRLQAYSWPHILRDNSFICVNGPSTGKTFAFLPAVCSVVQNLLFNGCAILITTAPGYRRLYERVPEAFVRKRIQTVVIDNIEEIWPQFAPELRLLCKNCEKPGLQMIVTAGHWIPVLAIFLQRYHNMIICIGAFIEAAVYAKAEFSFRLFSSDQQKEIELIKHLKQHDYRNERTIVFGKDSNDLLPIVNVLKQNSINHIVCNERTVLQQHAGFRNWDEQLQGDMVVFVCSDEMLGDLKITMAQHIIHYFLPSTWSTFTRRYACSFEYYESPYLPSESKQEKGKPSSIVLLNENNNQELPRLVDFLELHVPKVSEKLLTYAKAHYSNADRHRMHGEPRRNELCAVYHEQNYSRCRIINYEETNLDNREVQLQLIDTGRIIHVKSCVLLFLPEQFRELPGQAFNVRIAALVPHDYEQDWDKTASLTVRQWIEEHENRPNCYIEGNVLLALKDTLWIDDLHLIEQLKGVKATVTAKRIGATVISKQFGIGDKQSFEQIRKIVQDCEKLAMHSMRHEAQEYEKQDKQEDGHNRLDEPDNVEELEMNPDNQISDQRMELIQADQKFEHIQTNRPLVQCDDAELENGEKLAETDDHNMLVPVELNDTCSSSSSFEELSLYRDNIGQYQFDTLLVNNVYNVTIGHYLAPDNFYVYRCDRILEIDAAIKEFVKDGRNLTPLKKPCIHQHCLVFYENFYHRARITNVLESSNGIEAEVRLRGQWHTYIPRMVQRNGPKMSQMQYMINGWKNTTKAPSSPESREYYRVEIQNLSKDATAMLVQEDFDDEESTVADTDDNFTQVNFTQQELMNMMKELATPRNEQNKSKPSSLETQEIEGPQRLTEEAVARNDDHSSSPDSRTPLQTKSNEPKESKICLRSDRKLPLKPLVSDYRFAQTVWQQDKYFIVLRVHAPDVKRYDLMVSNNSLLLQFVKTDDEQRYIVPLNLFSTIDAQHTVHEIRGLSIVVRLRKLVPSIRWPKLYKYGRKLAWVKAASTAANDSDSSSDEMVKKNRWNCLVQAQLDSSVDSSQSGNEKDVDSDVEDEEGLFLAMN
uniref:RNA helicase n=1 Tax=Anopheles culicifacies TaxID=139723 RepID=A0A182M665_9DIPT